MLIFIFLQLLLLLGCGFIVLHCTLLLQQLVFFSTLWDLLYFGYLIHAYCFTLGSSVLIIFSLRFLLLNIFLLQEYRTIAKMRLGHITSSAPKPSQFTVLIRAIPWHPEQSYSDTLSKYFTNYYSSCYLSHQMVYHNGIIQRLLVCTLMGSLSGLFLLLPVWF